MHNIYTYIRVTPGRTQELAILKPQEDEDATMCWLPLSCPCVIFLTIFIIMDACERWSSYATHALPIIAEAAILRASVCDANVSWVAYMQAARTGTVCELSMKHLFKFNANSQSTYIRESHWSPGEYHTNDGTQIWKIGIVEIKVKHSIGKSFYTETPTDMKEWERDWLANSYGLFLYNDFWKLRSAFCVVSRLGSVI